MTRFKKSDDISCHFRENINGSVSVIFLNGSTLKAAYLLVSRGFFRVIFRVIFTRKTCLFGEKQLLKQENYIHEKRPQMLDFPTFTAKKRSP